MCLCLLILTSDNACMMFECVHACMHGHVAHKGENFMTSRSIKLILWEDFLSAASTNIDLYEQVC